MTYYLVRGPNCQSEYCQPADGRLEQKINHRMPFIFSYECEACVLRPQQSLRIRAILSAEPEEGCLYLIDSRLCLRRSPYKCCSPLHPAEHVALWLLLSLNSALSWCGLHTAPLDRGGRSTRFAGIDLCRDHAAAHARRAYSFIFHTILTPK